MIVRHHLNNCKLSEINLIGPAELKLRPSSFNAVNSIQLRPLTTSYAYNYGHYVHVCNRESILVLFNVHVYHCSLCYDGGYRSVQLGSRSTHHPLIRLLVRFPPPLRSQYLLVHVSALATRHGHTHEKEEWHFLENWSGFCTDSEFLPSLSLHWSVLVTRE